METLLEQQRRYHEERERLMDAMVKESLHPAKAVRMNWRYRRLCSICHMFSRPSIA